jgi:hypothetical protein
LPANCSIDHLATKEHEVKEEDKKKGVCLKGTLKRARRASNLSQLLTFLSSQLLSFPHHPDQL